MATAGDLGLDLTPDGIATMNRLNELEDVTIEVGYQADQKAADGETSLAEIVYWNHYGTVHKDGSVMIPARPFMDTIKKHSEELSEFSQQALSSLDTADAGCQRDRLAGEVHDSRSDKRRRMDSKCADNG